MLNDDIDIQTQQLGKSMHQPEVFSFVTSENLALHMTLYRAEHDRKNATILYFHGGGLLFGTRDDLPQSYLNKFLLAGYDFLAMDYPLAPESKLDVILESVFQLVLFYLSNKKKIFALDNDRYVLFGRSAGAYLALMLCDMLRKRGTPMPGAIISLYGYARLDETTFCTPNKHHASLPGMSDESMAKIISDRPISDAPINERFPLYIKARQQGIWLALLGAKEDTEKYSLDAESLAAFPPTILAAATMDPDVPYKMSKSISKLIPDARLVTIFGDTHDFDRDTHSESGRLVYAEIVKWLSQYFPNGENNGPHARASCR